MRPQAVVSRGRALTLALLAAAAWTALECSPATSSTTDGGADAAACPQDLPASCPARVPSYQTDVEGIIASKCNGCHTDGGVGSSKFDFSTYASVYADRSSMLNQIVKFSVGRERPLSGRSSSRGSCATRRTTSPAVDAGPSLAWAPAFNATRVGWLLDRLKPRGSKTHWNDDRSPPPRGRAPMSQGSADDTHPCHNAPTGTACRLGPKGTMVEPV